MENYYGVLSGLAYTLPYMITGLVMGAVTSRINRVKVFAASLIVGGFSQILTGLVPSFGVLSGMRVLHGATNAVSSPTTYSLVADFVPPEKRATANSILSTAVYAGISLSSLSILLIKQMGWQATYKIIGVITAITGLLFAATIREPKNRWNGRIYTEEEITEYDARRSAEDKEEDNKPFRAKDLVNDMKRTILDLWKRPTARWVTMGAFVRTFGGIASAVYLPIYFLKVYPDYKT